MVMFVIYKLWLAIMQTVFYFSLFLALCKIYVLLFSIMNLIIQILEAQNCLASAVYSYGVCFFEGLCCHIWSTLTCGEGLNWGCFSLERISVSFMLWIKDAPLLRYSQVQIDVGSGTLRLGICLWLAYILIMTPLKAPSHTYHVLLMPPPQCLV